MGGKLSHTVIACTDNFIHCNPLKCLNKKLCVYRTRYSNKKTNECVGVVHPNPIVLPKSLLLCTVGLVLRSAGCLWTSLGWFKNIEPRRTFPNHIITEIARFLEFCHMSSGWFDCTEPSLSTSLQEKQGVQGESHPGQLFFFLSKRKSCPGCS